VQRGSGTPYTGRGRESKGRRQGRGEARRSAMMAIMAVAVCCEGKEGRREGLGRLIWSIEEGGGCRGEGGERARGRGTTGGVRFGREKEPAGGGRRG
jgi:hypothetical protein